MSRPLWFHLSGVGHHVALKGQLGARVYRLFTMIGKLEEEYMLKDYLTSQQEFAQINQELYVSPTNKNVLCMAGPCHKGFDATVQSARRQPARAIVLPQPLRVPMQRERCKPPLVQESCAATSSRI